MTPQSPANLRPQLAQHLRARLHSFEEGFRHNLAIIGPPGSGKTFQLQQLLAWAGGAARRSPEAPLTVTPIYCPLYQESCRSFLSRLLSAIAKAGLPAERGSLTATNQPLETLLRQLEPCLPKTAAALRPIEGLVGRRLFGEAFNRTLDAIPVLGQERAQSCVLILDEFLFLEEMGLSHAFHELGKRVMTWPSTLFILTSSAPHRARVILRERLQLLFGQFELVTLDAPDTAATLAWTRQELRGLRGANMVVPFLIQWLGGSPWYLTVFLKRLKELAALGNHPELSEALFLHAAWDLLGNAEGTFHQWCVSKTERLARGRVGARGLEALMQAADGARTATEIGKRIGRAGLSETLQLLAEQDLAQRNGTCWMVTDPVLRCWLTSVLSAQRAEPQLDRADARERFERCLRSLWSRWMRTHQLSFPQQVVGLFQQFDDETVSLDAKTGRLPKFETIDTRRPDDPAAADAYLIARGEGKRWCATIQEGAVGEQAIASFDAFCRGQTPKPSRKVVITKSPMDQNARLLAKAASMWVWEAEDVRTLMGLYGQF